MKAFITSALLMFTPIAFAQPGLNGHVLDATDGNPIPGVSVYFPQLEKGGITDASGYFELRNLPQGSFKFLASYLGYETHSQTVILAAAVNSLEIRLRPTAIEMEEVIVSTPFHKLQGENVMKVEQLKIADLNSRGAFTLADGITRIPGVESVSTGMGIGKPVIRGLSANRVVVYTQGIRLENQQFGDEHGLGINAAGLESVEVIKGPATLLYGSDALGGVLYLNPEKFAVENTRQGDLGMDYYSNTSGITANAGLRASGERFKYLLRAAAVTHADYKTGHSGRVTNSRFREYDLKTGIGYQAAAFKSDLRYNFNSAELGIPEEIGVQSTNRNPVLPLQELSNHILSSGTDLFLDETHLKFIFGFIHNTRKEFEEEEGAGVPALHMKLGTLNYNLQYHLPRTEKIETVLGIQGMHQTNKNLGEEVLIPDARTNDFGILATSHFHFRKGDLQLGLRYDLRDLSGEEYGSPSSEGYIAPFSNNYSSFNAALGYRLDLSNNLMGRFNMATGFRAPNLSELTSNGVHEGTNRYEIGNSSLRREQNLQTDLALEFKNEHLEWFANVFYNGISSYIFLEPNGAVQEGNPVYEYNQQDAELYGGELGLHLHPHPLDWLHLESSFELVRGRLKEGSYLPLIPANSLTNTLRVEFDKGQGNWGKRYAFLTLQTVFRQDRVSDFETTTGGYTLLDLGVGSFMELFGQEMELSLSGSNLLGEVYISHLSRLKPNGIQNMGRNIRLGLRLPF